MRQVKGRSASRLASPVFHYPGMTDHVLRLIVLRLSAALATPSGLQQRKRDTLSSFQAESVMNLGPIPNLPGTYYIVP